MRAFILGVELLLVSLAAFPAPVGATGPVLNHCIYSWTAPTTNVDGGALTDLAGFNVYISPTPGGPYTNLAVVPSTNTTGGTGYTTANLCGGLTDGQKYATVAAFDTANNEGPKMADFPFVLNVVAPAAPTSPALVK